MASTQERIVEAALSLIAERGLSEVTMVDIARTASVARQTLYNHYADIPAIVSDAASHHNVVAIEQLRQALSVVDAPGEVIRQLVRHVASISAHPGHTLDSHHGLPVEVREQLGGFDRALQDEIRRALSDGLERGEFRADLDVETDSALMRHALGGVSALVAENPAAASRIVGNSTRTLLAALGHEDRVQD